jgi:hypothetical protein
VDSTGWCQCAAAKIPDISDDGADGKRAVENTTPPWRQPQQQRQRRKKMIGNNGDQQQQTHARDDVWHVLQRGIQRQAMDRLVDA